MIEKDEPECEPAAGIKAEIAAMKVFEYGRSANGRGFGIQGKAFALFCAREPATPYESALRTAGLTMMHGKG